LDTPSYGQYRTTPVRGKPNEGERVMLPEGHTVYILNLFLPL